MCARLPRNRFESAGNDIVMVPEIFKCIESMFWHFWLHNIGHLPMKFKELFARIISPFSENVNKKVWNKPNPGPEPSTFQIGQHRMRAQLFRFFFLPPTKECFFPFAYVMSDRKKKHSTGNISTRFFRNPAIWVGTSRIAPRRTAWKREEKKRVMKCFFETSERFLKAEKENFSPLGICVWMFLTNFLGCWKPVWLFVSFFLRFTFFARLSWMCASVFEKLENNKDEWDWGRGEGREKEQEEVFF